MAAGVFTAPCVCTVTALDGCSLNQCHDPQLSRPAPLPLTCLSPTLCWIIPQGLPLVDEPIYLPYIKLIMTLYHAGLLCSRVVAHGVHSHSAVGLPRTAAALGIDLSAPRRSSRLGSHDPTHQRLCFSFTGHGSRAAKG
jgi:hypothetical protein